MKKLSARSFLKSIFLLNLPPGERIAAYALFISICTMIFGFYQFKSQNDYANKQLEMAVATTKLAYRPFVGIHTNNSSLQSPLGITLTNDGNGPAILFQVDVYYKNALIDIAGLDGILDNTDRFWKDDSGYLWHKIRSSMSLRSGDKLPVLTVAPEAFVNSNNALARVLENMSVVVLYTSLTKDTAMSVYNTHLLNAENTARYPANLLAAA